MKKNLLLILSILYSILGHSQFFENFENASVTVPNGFPAGWLVTDNGVGTSVNWTITNNPSVVIDSTKSAFINRQDIGQGNTSEDWLITPSILVPTNGQLRFLARQTLSGDNGSIYQIRVSTGTVQSNLSSYTVLQQWTESQMNQVFDVTEEKVVDFPPSLFGLSVNIAFVRVNTQPTGTISGDRWVIDNINIVQKCLNPTNIAVNNITTSSVILNWMPASSQVASNYEVKVTLVDIESTVIINTNSLYNNFVIIGLTQNTCYKAYIRTNCDNGSFGDWVGPINFCTTPDGMTCSNPLFIYSLPFQTSETTASFGNMLAGPQTSSCISGGVNYQAGNDVFYSYTATEDCLVSFTLNSPQVGSSMFVYQNCAGIPNGPCLAAVGNSTNNERVINYNVVAGTIYIIVISSSDLSPVVNYDLIIQCNGCADKPTDLTFSNVTSTSADLSWTAPLGSPPISYQIAVQPQGSPVPSGAGQYTSTVPNFTFSEVQPDNYYQYWVRSECAPGLFSSWVGPMVFIEETCPKPTNLGVSQITTTSATVSWVEVGSASQWEVLLLAAPNGVEPETPGIIPTVGAQDVFIQNISGATNVTTTLNNGTISYYYVRSVCQPGDEKSPWAGPYTFNTTTCPIEEKCAYRFFLTNQIGNNWSNGRMQVRQNGIVVETLGNSGVNNPNGIVVQICNNLPFDLFWSQEGSQPQLMGVKIENTFGEVVFNKLPGEGTPLTVLYSDTSLGNCLPPSCPSPLDLLVSTQTATSANLSWDEVGTADQWEVFVTPIGTSAPLNSTPVNSGLPNYFLSNTNTAFLLSGLSGSGNDFYVRAICSSTDVSNWTKINAKPSDKIVLVAFLDENGNGVKEANEGNFQFGSYTYLKNNVGSLTVVSSQTGDFTLIDYNPVNTYDFNYEIYPEYASYYAETPTNFNDLNVVVGGGVQTLYFPIVSTQVYTDVSAVIISPTPPNPGFYYTHTINYQNLGSTITSGTITYTKSNPNITITAISVSPTVATSNGFTYDYTNLLPGQTMNIMVTMLVATIPTVNLGEVIVNTVAITSDISEINTDNNTFTTNQTVVGSYDPNDKMEARGENVQIGQFSQDDYLFYTIRFQNTGTANAVTVRIEDTLASEFDFASFRMISASHDYSVERVNNKLIWTFNDIDLPTEEEDELGSNGYVMFKIKLNPGFEVGDVIENTAEIYFDFNPAIITNTFQTTFVPNLSTPTFEGNNLLIYPNPATELVQVSLQNTTETISQIVIYDVIGKKVLSLSANNTQQTSINVGSLSKGIYLIEITTESNLKQVRKFVKN